MERYQAIYQFTYSHAYAGESEPLAFHVEPSADTLHVLEQAQSTFRQTRNGFELAVTEWGRKVLDIWAETESTRFLFCVYCHDTEFNVFTSDSLKPGISCFYVSDNNANVSGRNLHEGTHLNAQDIYSLELPPEVIDEPPPTHSEITLLPFLPAHCQAALSNESRVKSPILIIDLSLASILTNSAQQPVQNSVAFNAQQYVWKYLIFGGEQYQKLRIIDLKGEIQFEYKGKETIGHRESDVFMSSIPIPFQKQFIRQFQLKDVGSRFENIIVSRLPVASVSSCPVIGPETSGPRATEIFVNL